MSITLIQDIGQRVIMAESFNLKSFLNDYKQYGQNSFTSTANGRKAMEERELANAKKAIEDGSDLLSITLHEKLISDRVLQQFGDTVMNRVKELFNPISDYFEKYDIVFDEKKLFDAMQADAKQMFYTKQALSEEAAKGTKGQKFDSFYYLYGPTDDLKNI